MSAKESKALLDRGGKPLYVESKNAGGKPKLYDKVKSQWRDTLGRSSERPFTLKDFRDFGSLLLQNSPFRTYRVSWLGHPPKQVDEKNYSGEEDTRDACKDLSRSATFKWMWPMRTWRSIGRGVSSAVMVA